MYEIEERLGEPGGFGETFRAHNGLKHFALKGVEDYDEAEREAEKLVQAGNHDNVVSVFEVVDRDAVVDVPGIVKDKWRGFIVMDYLDGKTLESYLSEQGSLTPGHWLTIVLPLLNGLRHIHECGLVHRDIKPDNIMLVDGQPVFIDLGLAKRLGVQPTYVGGAPGYKPPEWEDGGVQDGRYDMYQLALVSYRALFGELLPDREQMRVALQANPSPFISGLGKALESMPTNRPKTVWDWLTTMVAAPSDMEGTGASEDEELHSSSDWSKDQTTTSSTVRTAEPSVHTQVTGEVNVASLLKEIERDFELPDGSLVFVRDDGSVVNGGMLLRNFREKNGAKWAEDDNTLADLADNISQRYGDIHKPNWVRFLDPRKTGTKAEKMYPSKNLLVKNMKRDYGLDSQ